MSQPLTPKQQRIFDIIKAGIKRNGYPPTVREIGEAAGLRSTSTVQNHIETLERKGYIRRPATKSQAVTVLEPDFYEVQPSVFAAPLPCEEIRFTVTLDDGVIDFIGTVRRGIDNSRS